MQRPFLGIFVSLTLFLGTFPGTSLTYGLPVDGAKYPLDLDAEGIRLPKIANSKMAAVLEDPETIFYKLPRMYQHYTPPAQILSHNSTTGTNSNSLVPEAWGTFYDSYLPDFNGNRAFPWETTLGLNLAAKEKLDEKRYGAVNFLKLPNRPDGTLYPILILNERPVSWVFPGGTIVGEILWVKDDNGKKWIYEIRARQKHNSGYSWDPIILRPMETLAELLSFLRYPSDWKAPRTYMFLRNVHEDMVFKMEGMIDRIPTLKPEEVTRILQLPFRDVTYSYWSNNNITPASDQEFSIFPKNYNLGLIQPDEVNCMGCHRQTSISLRELIPKEPLIMDNPEKVANIRGNDGIFTWYPFEADTIGGNSKLRWRALDLRLKRIKVHKEGAPIDTSVYRLTKFVQEALPAYQLPRIAEILHSSGPGNGR